MAIEAGMSHTCETMVDQHNVAKSVGSGRVDVFSTSMMILLIEQAEISAQMKNTLRACRVFFAPAATARLCVPVCLRRIKNPYHRDNTKL